MPGQTPAQTLRAAAARLREAVADVAHVPVPWTQPPYPAKQGVLVAPGEETPILMAFWGGMGEYVALLNPAVSAAVADWLEREARSHDATVQAAAQVFHDDPQAGVAWIAEQTNEAALLVARAILGEVAE